jgi:hypothetical protein
MNHFISKAWPSDNLLGIAECIVMVWVLSVVAVTVLRMLLNLSYFPSQK